MADEITSSQARRALSRSHFISFQICLSKPHFKCVYGCQAEISRLREREQSLTISLQNQNQNQNQNHSQFRSSSGQAPNATFIAARTGASDASRHEPRRHPRDIARHAYITHNDSCSSSSSPASVSSSSSSHSSLESSVSSTQSSPRTRSSPSTRYACVCQQICSSSAGLLWRASPLGYSPLSQGLLACIPDRHELAPNSACGCHATQRALGHRDMSRDSSGRCFACIAASPCSCSPFAPKLASLSQHEPGERTRERRRQRRP